MSCDLTGVLAFERLSRIRRVLLDVRNENPVSESDICFAIMDTEEFIAAARPSVPACTSADVLPFVKPPGWVSKKFPPSYDGPKGVA